MYGDVSPLAFKTRVIPSSEANVDPIFQQTSIEEFNGLLNKGMFLLNRVKPMDTGSTKVDSLTR